MLAIMSKSQKTDTASAFTENLKKIRKAKALTGPQLAKLSGIGYRSMNNYEVGIRFPTLGKLGWICDALGVTPNDLLGYSDKGKLQFDDLKRCIEHVTPHLLERGADWDEVAEAIVAAYTGLLVFGKDPASLIDDSDKNEK